MATGDILRGMSRQWAEQIVKRAQPVLATVAGETDNGLLLVNIEGDGTGTGNVPEVATPNGPYDYQSGDRVFVYRSRNRAIPHQVSGFYYSDTDGTFYPRQQVDYIKAPGGTLEFDATDITLLGDSIVPTGKVKISSNDSTAGFVEDKIVAGAGLAASTLNDGGDEDLQLDLDINGLTADATPDGANDYVATHDASAGTVKKVLLNNLPGGGGAPTDATYIVQTANGTLTNEQALSALASGDVQVTTTTGVLSSLKANRSASAAPTTSDDSSAGYSVGSRWIDTTNDKEYVCLDASVGAAVWTETTASAGAGTGDVSGPVTSTDNAIARWDGTGGDTLQDSGPTISDGGKLTLPDSASVPPLNVTERSAAPSSPASGDVYLDDGTNTGSGNPGWRRYTGAAWEDVSAAAGGGGTDADAIHDNVSGEINALSALTSISTSDVLLIEEAAASYAKRKLTGSTLLSAELVASALGASLYIRNASGATAADGDIGFVEYSATYGLVYNTTTTAGEATDQFAYVISGGANGSSIYVLTRLHTTAIGAAVPVNYAGTAPSAGDFLIASTTAGKAQRQAYASPAIFAVCVGSGSGGTVQAQLLMNRTRTPLVSDNDILRINATSDFTTGGWAGAVNDAAPTSSPVTVSTSSGAIGSITPVSASEHGHIVIHNLTRGNSALVSSISGNDVTFVSDTPLASWVNGDSLTASSQTITGATFMDVDLSNSSLFPGLMVELGLTAVWRDTGGIKNLNVHPYEAYSNSKTKFVRGQVAGVFVQPFFAVPVVNKHFGVAASATGSGTGLAILRAQFAVVAAP